MESPGLALFVSPVRGNSRAVGAFVAAGRAHLLNHLSGQRARQRTCGRLTRKLKTLRPEFAVSVIALLHGANHAEEHCECLSSQTTEEFFRA